MRYLGIDYGTKKVGLALSDEGGQFAFPYSILKNNRDLFFEIKKVCDQEKVEAIIVGYSLTQHGEENDVVEVADTFTEKLGTILGLPIHKQNELFSSAEAHRYQIKKGDRDDSAAAIILQRFLDAKK